jgi:hypothetical protein
MSEEQEKDFRWWMNDPLKGADHFAENRNKNFRLLEPYNHMVVAWYPDGSGIFGADTDGVALWERIKASGDDPRWYVFEYVDPVA